jgi:hypothetical protein
MARAAKTALSDGLSISPARLRNAIMHCTSIQQPLMIWGQPGIGKSDIVADAARAAGRPLIDIRLPLMEPTDMRGIPYLADIKVTNAQGEVMRDDTGVPITQKEFRWSPPSDLPTDALSNALIFFDEISAAPPSVQAATYQITLNRRIGTYRLPENAVMVAAGNRVRDKGVAYNMPTPLANRFTHVTLEANVDDWKDWAIANKVNQDVVGYLSFQPQDLNNFNPSQEGYAFATPRTWSFVSRLLNDSSKLDPRTLSDLVRGTVGDAAGIKFLTYRKHTSSLPSARDILEGRVKKLKDPQPDIMYALIVALCYDLFNGFAKAKTAQTQGDREAIKTWHQTDVDTFLRFIMDNLPAELCVFAGKTLLTNENGVVISQQFLKHWLEFTNSFLELMPNKN